MAQVVGQVVTFEVMPDKQVEMPLVMVVSFKRAESHPVMSGTCAAHRGAAMASMAMAATA